MKELLHVCSLEERDTRKEQFHSLGCRLLCKTCKDPIVMDFFSLVCSCDILTCIFVNKQFLDRAL